MGPSPPAPSSLSGPQSKKKPKLLAFPEHFILSRLINRSVSLLIFKNLSEHRQVPRRPPPQDAVNLGNDSQVPLHFRFALTELHLF